VIAQGEVKILYWYTNWKGRNCKLKQVGNAEEGERREVKEGG
jgi:hypothetical protein